MHKKTTAGIIFFTLLLIGSYQFTRSIGLAMAASGHSVAINYPVINILRVAPGVSVTIQTRNFPSNLPFSVIMKPYGTDRYAEEDVATTLTADGLEETYPIPGYLSGLDKIEINLESPNRGLILSAWFSNQSNLYQYSFPFVASDSQPGAGGILVNQANSKNYAFPFISFEGNPVKTAMPGLHIGLIPGHTTTNPKSVQTDPGTVCSDGLTEQSVNYKIASQVKKALENTGYDVDLLDEYDGRMNDYKGLLLLSIHNDSCDPIGQQATGFKVAGNLYTQSADQSTRLSGCLINRYRKDTQLSFAYTSITPNMTRYHAFFVIDPQTPSAIIEGGFLNLDRKILTQHTDRVAAGITDGILCFLRHEYIGAIEP